MKKLLLVAALVGTLVFSSCYTHMDNDMIVVDFVINDEYGLTSIYYFHVSNTNSCYFIDATGAYNVGDTVFISSLKKAKENEDNERQR